MLTALDIAKVCHQVNKTYCESMGDMSQPNWEDAPEWQKKSAILGVEAALGNPDQTPEMSHEGWLKVKEEEGWVYGPVKDPEKKEHPCMVPYSALPPGQRAKDKFFLTVVNALRGAVDAT